MSHGIARTAESRERTMLIQTKTGADQRGEGSEDAFLGPGLNKSLKSLTDAPTFHEATCALAKSLWF